VWAAPDSVTDFCALKALPGKVTVYRSPWLLKGVVRQSSVGVQALAQIKATASKAIRNFLDNWFCIFKLISHRENL
jgi:hypothetical protein